MRYGMATIPALALALAGTACSGGALGDILGGVLTGGDGAGGGQGTVTVEVQEVRTQQQQIIVRTEDNQRGPVLFDNNTQVVYQNQQYPVTALDPGDIVDMRVQQVQQGYYTDLIQVRTPVQERQGGTTGGTTQPGVLQVEGTIDQIDTSRWMFTLNMTQGGTLPVYLTSNATQAQRNQLQQYRSGDYVRVQVRQRDQQTAELVSFGW